MRYTLGVMLTACTVAPAQTVELITEYFNYGTARSVSLSLFEGGSGWRCRRWNAEGSLYFPASQSSAVPHYRNCGNLPTSQGGGNATQRGSSRVFGTFMTGTVWLSYLAAANNRFDPDVALTFNNINAGGVGIIRNPRNGNEVFAWANGPGGKAIGTRPSRRRTGNLVIAKLEIDAIGRNDRISVWVDPSPTALTEVGLGTPDIATHNLGNIGANWNNLSILMGFNNGVDAIRIAHGPGSSDSKVRAVMTGLKRYPGTDGDLELSTGVRGATPTAFPDTKVARRGDRVELFVRAPCRTLVGDVLFMTATPRASVSSCAFAGLWIGVGTEFLLQPTVWFTPVLDANGNSLRLAIPQRAPAPSNVLVQAFVISPKPTSPLFVDATAAHELQIR